MKFNSTIFLGKAIDKSLNVLGKSGGTMLSGKFALRLRPDIIKTFKGIDPERVLFITGTNGKSTTNNLICHILTENGLNVVSNLEGANLISGIATSLLKASNMSGDIHADYYIFETDERFLPKIREQLPAANILITNLQKDQVQRNGDPDFICRHLETAMKDGVERIFVNNDEPRSASFARYAKKVVRFGARRHSLAFEKDSSYVTMACPFCRHKINFKYYNTDGIGSFECESCGYKSSDEVDYSVENADFGAGKFSINEAEFTMPYDMPHMIYNYSACMAVAKEMCGISEEDAAKAIADFKNIAGRFEVLHYKGKTIKYMRIKQENPETLQSAINIMAEDRENKMVCLGLAPVEDYVPHYTNTFYAYDCDFKRLAASNVEKFFCFTERVCYDSANRLIYDGVPRELIDIAESEEPETILKEIESAKTDSIYLITLLHTYEHLEKYLKKEGAEIE